MGMDVVQSDTQMVIYIREINRHTGSVAEYNENAETDKKIEVGDCIVKVNGITGSAMLERLKIDTSVAIEMLPSKLMTITIPKCDSLGLELVYSDDDKYVGIKFIQDGAVKRYNLTASTAQQVQVPARIMAVDDFWGNAKELVEKMQSSGNCVQLTLSQRDI